MNDWLSLVLALVSLGIMPLVSLGIMPLVSQGSMPLVAVSSTSGQSVQVFRGIKKYWKTDNSGTLAAHEY